MVWVTPWGPGNRSGCALRMKFAALEMAVEDVELGDEGWLIVIGDTACVGFAYRCE